MNNIRDVVFVKSSTCIVHALIASVRLFSLQPVKKRLTKLVLGESSF